MNGIAKATIIKVFNISGYLFVNLRIIKIMKNYILSMASDVCFIMQKKYVKFFQKFLNAY